MDRLDTWLSAQRGWRLLLVRCAAFAPFGLAAGSAWSSNVTSDPATPQVGAMVARMALCVAASFVLAALTLLTGHGHALRLWRARPVWRMVAGLYAFAANFAIGAYRDAEPLRSGWHHTAWIFPLQIALIVTYLAMTLWNARYMRTTPPLR